MVERALVIVTRELRAISATRASPVTGSTLVCGNASAKGLLAHHVMLVGKGRDLGQMRDDDDLGTLGKRGETPGDRVAVAPPIPESTSSKIMVVRPPSCPAEA